MVCAVLSGNRNFEARIHGEVKANYLASPPLVVAYALAGRMDLDLLTEPIGQDEDGNDVFLRDIWPSSDEIQQTIAGAVQGDMFRRTYADVYTGDETWRSLDIPEGALRLGSGLDLRAPAAVLRRDVTRAGRGRAGAAARAASSRSATPSRPTTSRRRGRSVRTARPAST